MALALFDLVRHRWSFLIIGEVFRQIMGIELYLAGGSLQWIILGINI